MGWLWALLGAVSARQHPAISPDSSHFWEGSVVTYSDSMRSISSVTGDTAWFYDAEPKILRVDDSSTLKAIQSPVLVEFFAPWCPHCQHFRDDFIASARKLHHKRPELTVAAVDCVAHDDLCNEYDIQGFPTVRLLNVKAKPMEFKGKFHAEALVDWVLKVVGGIEVIDEEKPKNKRRRRVPKPELGSDKLPASPTAEPPPTSLKVDLHTPTTKPPNFSQGSQQTGNIINLKRQQSKRNTTKIQTVHVNPSTSQAVIIRPESVVRNLFGRAQMPDVMSAVVFWLHHNVFIGASRLQGVRFASFKQILASLQLFFFQVCAGSESADVSAMFQSLQIIDDSLPQSGIDKTEWLPLLQESGLSSVLTWTAQCTTSSSPFTCGLWLLFHSMIGHAQNSEQATAACQAIIAVVRFFFGCDSCRDHFLTMIPEVENRVLEREDAMMWLWRSHNAVNLRLDQNERDQTGASTKAQRPTAVECSNCHIASGEGWNLELVTDWLLTSYGPPPVCIPLAPNVSSATRLSSSITSPSYAVLFLFFCGVVLAVVLPGSSASMQRSLFPKKRMSPTPPRRQLIRLDV